VDEIVLTAEAGGGQTQAAPDIPKSSFLYQRMAGRWSPSEQLDIAASLRATEDLARDPDPGSVYTTGGDVVLFGALDVTYDVTENWNVSLGVNGSPSSRRNVAIPNPLTAAQRPPSDQDPDALVRANTSSIGGLLEAGYDSFDLDHPHDVDVAIDGSVALTRFFTDQTITDGAFTASQFTARKASLAQVRLGGTGTFTIAENTDLGLDAAYFVYDTGKPGNVGVFTEATAANLQTSFGAGLPMLPPRWTLRPEIAERIGKVTLRAYYQYANLAVDGAVGGHTVGGKAQVAVGNVKIFVTGSYRADVFTDATATTWSLGAGLSIRF
jgi:hypothetical protein